MIEACRMMIKRELEPPNDEPAETPTPGNVAKDHRRVLKNLPQRVAKSLESGNKEKPMCTNLFRSLKNFLGLIARCRVFIGRNPDHLPAPAIVFFPLWPGRLNCGFAGLMTCRFQESAANPSDDLTIDALWKKIKKADLQSILSGENAAETFLDSVHTVQAVNDAVLELKSEQAQEFLFFETSRAAALAKITAEMRKFLAAEEKILDDRAAAISSADLEVINGRMIQLKDICWMLEKDILANLQKVLALAGSEKPSSVASAAFRKYRKLNLLLNALDRLEVRGRDSAGLQLNFTLKSGNELQTIIGRIQANGLADDFEQRTQENDLQNGSIFVSHDRPGSPDCVNVTFTYKTFSIVGELGRNVADLRKSIREDRILHYFTVAESVCETALTHTRWASVGSITELNCHPVNNFTLTCIPPVCPFYPGRKVQINAVLNGDIDNYPALRDALEADGELIVPEMTTDTKIIPLQIEKYLRTGNDLAGAFRLAVNDFEGSHAIVMQSNLEPGKMFLALKGSGQSIYVGINADQYMFSSELYGLVEVMPRFLKMNGETGNGAASGQIFILDQNRGHGLAGISASFYNGTAIKLTDHMLQTAEITTRDIDRSDYPHYFLKEISESALSIRRTLRGKYRINPSGRPAPDVTFNFGADMVPAAVRRCLQKGSIRNIVVIGHGTAAVAGQAVADALSHYLKGTPLSIVSRIASELSGFGLKDDLTDTLIIPVTQSGTTTDTNRAVAMARERGAYVISIVNRRQSDITAKSHGVFYTSDGRDIEMSVASTKAFYAQIIAGQLLALYFAQLLGSRSDEAIADALRHLESAPQLMNRLFENRDAIAASVRQAVSKRHWAVVGSGPNKAAADEIRIKLSELCYRTISSDIVENKKHIDLSAEPLILVCASGNPQAVMEDVVKDVAIFKAHKATVIVFADEGDHRFDQVADAVIAIPVAPPPLPVILNTMAGHLWGYYAARTIDEGARMLREFRSRLTAELMERAKKSLSIIDMIADTSFRRIINEFYMVFNQHRLDGSISVLTGKTIADLLLLLKYAAGKLPLQDIRHEFKGEGGLISPFDLLDASLGAAIDELTRPIDAIRHQAKTVTVGTSRKEKEIKGIIFDLLESLNFSIKNLTYRNVLTLNRVQPAIASIRGCTLYAIRNLDEQGNPSENTLIEILRKDGVAAQMKSRSDQPAVLMGTKKTIVSTGHVHIGKGRSDGASILVVPLLEETNIVTNLLLLHIDYNEALPLEAKIDVLGYRYADIRNLVNEYNLPWQDDHLKSLTLESLFCESIEAIAGQIRSRISQSQIL